MSSIEERRYLRFWYDDRSSCVDLCPAVLSALGYSEVPLTGKVGDGIFAKGRKEWGDQHVEVSCFWAREEGSEPDNMLEAKYLGILATGTDGAKKAVAEVAEKIEFHLENPEEQLPGWEWDRTSFNEMLVKEAKTRRLEEKQKHLHGST